MPIDVKAAPAGASPPEPPAPATDASPRQARAADDANTADASTAAEAAAEDVTWEVDETPATRLLRALFTLVAGAFLAWSQFHTTLNSGPQWGQWVLLSVIANFLLPLFIVWMFFAQGMLRLDWLRDQRLNAWNYGFSFGAWRRHLLLAGAMFAAMLPLLWFASCDDATRTYYHLYFPPTNGVAGWAWLLGTLLVYMFCWEWFHRGFLLFGIAQGMGPVLAITLQALLFAAAHVTKPLPELCGALAGGLVLGVVAWREKSFAPAFYTHALVHIAWAVLVLT